MRNAMFAASVVVFGLAVQGCGEVQGSDPVETARAELGSFFPSWSDMSVGFSDGPALVQTNAAQKTLAAFGLVNGMSRIGATSQQTGFGRWTGQLTLLPLAANGVVFTSHPSATGFDVPSSSPLTGLYAVVARGSDNRYYITICDEFGGRIFQNWSAIPNGAFSAAPAIAFVPQGSLQGPKRTLILVGLGQDGRIYEARNTLSTDFRYFHQAWTGFSPIQNDTFIEAPAISWACPPTASSAAVIVAAMATQGSSNVFRFTKLMPSGWTTWQQAQNGTFFDGPALASRTNCSSDGISETAIFGRGGDNAIWVSTQISGGPNGFHQVSPETFTGMPGAAGFESSMVVSASNGSTSKSNRAQSP